MRVEGCGLRDVTFILGEMREEEEEKDGGRERWRDEALEQLFKS